MTKWIVSLVLSLYLPLYLPIHECLDYIFNCIFVIYSTAFNYIYIISEPFIGKIVNSSGKSKAPTALEYIFLSAHFKTIMALGGLSEPLIFHFTIHNVTSHIKQLGQTQEFTSFLTTIIGGFDISKFCVSTDMISPKQTSVPLIL